MWESKHGGFPLPNTSSSTRDTWYSWEGMYPSGRTHSRTSSYKISNRCLKMCTNFISPHQSDKRVSITQSWSMTMNWVLLYLQCTKKFSRGRRIWRNDPHYDWSAGMLHAGSHDQCVWSLFARRTKRFWGIYWVFLLWVMKVQATRKLHLICTSVWHRMIPYYSFFYTMNLFRLWLDILSSCRPKIFRFVASGVARLGNEPSRAKFEVSSVRVEPSWPQTRPSSQIPEPSWTPTRLGHDRARLGS